MKRNFIISMLMIVSGVCFSQTRETIINTLESPDANGNVIIVESDSAITDLLGTPNNKMVVRDNAETVKMNGFRILAYMSNDHKKGRSETANRKRKIKEAFADIEAYDNFVSPNWKLLVGDFVTREEANIFRQQLQKEFPEFGKEIYIVPDIINAPVE